MHMRFFVHQTTDAVSPKGKMDSFPVGSYRQGYVDGVLDGATVNWWYTNNPGDTPGLLREGGFSIVDTLAVSAAHDEVWAEVTGAGPATDVNVGIRSS